MWKSYKNIMGKYVFILIGVCYESVGFDEIVC